MNYRNYFAGNVQQLRWRRSEAKSTVGRQLLKAAIRPDVRIYNYALTDVQVKSLYNQGSAIRFTK